MKYFMNFLVYKKAIYHQATCPKKVTHQLL